MINNDINLLFQRACLLDIIALKPGNVGIHAPGFNMTAQDFIDSAANSGQALCQTQLTLGERILHAVQTNVETMAYNTNLGIILLCAPLIQSIYLIQENKVNNNLRIAVNKVLKRTTINDAILVYKAICLSKAGNLGNVETADIKETPDIDLLAVMHLAADRDTIAKQYITGYQLLFDTVVPLLLEFSCHNDYYSAVVTDAYLALLGKIPDTLVSRKYGMTKSKIISRQVLLLSKRIKKCKGSIKFEQELLKLDCELKKEGINPGTTADLVVAGIFISSLEEALRTQ